MILDTLLFGGTLGCYLVASVGYQLHLFTGSDPARRLATGVLTAGILLHAVALGERWLDPTIPRMPTDARTLSTIAWLVALVQLGIDRRQGWRAIGALSIPIAFVGVFYAKMLAAAATAATPTQNPWMAPHLIAIILGFAGFALSFCMAVAYLVQSSLIKRKQLRGPFSRLPPLESVAAAAQWLATIGFSMLTLGILTGVLVALRQGAAGWYLDARVVTSLVAWLVYAAYLIATLLGGWHGRKTTYVLIGGFATVLVAYVVNLL